MSTFMQRTNPSGYAGLGTAMIDAAHGLASVYNNLVNSPGKPTVVHEGRASTRVGRRNTPKNFPKQDSKSTSTTLSSTKATVKSPTPTTTEYARNVQALLHPYVAAIGQLPKQFKTILSQIQGSTDYTPQEADQALQDLASKYSPDITASPTGGSSQLASAEQHVETKIKTLESSSSQYNQALKSFGKDMSTWTKIAPYKDIMTALFQHLRYSAIYTGTLPGQGKYPEWLNYIYSTALSQPNPFLSTAAATGAKAASTNPNVPLPALNTLGKAAKTTKKSPTYTPAPASSGSGTGNG